MNLQNVVTNEVKKDSLKKGVRSLLQPPRCRGSTAHGATESSVMRRWNEPFLKEIRTLVEVVATEQVCRELHEIKALLNSVARQVLPAAEQWRRYANVVASDPGYEEADHGPHASRKAVP